MKIVLRIFRVIIKLALLIYVSVINFLLVFLFYTMILELFFGGILRLELRLHEEQPVLLHFVYWLPVYVVAFYTLYCLSPLSVWMIRRRERLVPLNSAEKMQVNSLLAEMGVDRNLKIYRNNDPCLNAFAFGFNTIGLTGGTWATSSDEELKGVISHEIGHILHYDFVYRNLLFSMEWLGKRALYGLFWVPIKIFGLIFMVVASIIPIAGGIFRLMNSLWWLSYRFLDSVIYGISRFTEVNINKYSEYRCDAYAAKYGCAYGLFSFLSKLQDAAEYKERFSFSRYIMSTHPATHKRIARLRKMIQFA